MPVRKRLFFGPPKPNGTKVEYLYRDAGNWKFWGEFVLSGAVTFAEIEVLLFDRLWFTPEEIGVESLTPKIRNEDDHPLHEIHEMTLVPTADALMTAEEFIARLEKARFPDYLFRELPAWLQTHSNAAL